MREVLLFIFNLISDFISKSMTWKIYGDFSLTHFIFGGLLLIAIFSLFGFIVPHFGDGINYGILRFKNYENKKDKDKYYHMIKSSYHGNGVTTHVRYKVNRKTGDVKEL